MHKSELGPFKTTFAENIYIQKYGHLGTWDTLSKTIVRDVCSSILTKDECDELTQLIRTMKFIPGGRYLFYAGKPFKAWNNCYAFDTLEDTREEWGRICKVVSDALMTGGGLGVCYSRLRARGKPLKKTGGTASGPVPLMRSVNEIGRNVMQGGGRRSAIYASLHWWHDDIIEFLNVKNWHMLPIGKARHGSRVYTLQDAKEDDFNFPAPLDMTNISVNYDNEFLAPNTTMADTAKIVFNMNCLHALMTGDPGFSFNFGDKNNEYLRNACCEFTTETDSDICNLGSVNLGNIESLQEFRYVVELATKFLLCGSLLAHLPGEKFYEVREKNRRIGLGLMGIHEWLLRRNYRYEMTEELREWLEVYAENSYVANKFCDSKSISKPKACRAIAPTGTIGIMACTTTGIEPLFATAFKRRYLVGGTQWKYEYVVDATAHHMIEELGLKADTIETAATLVDDVERRIKFQADVQDYVDMAISSTINLPEWGSDKNNQDRVKDFATLVRKYMGRLRGLTLYPNGARGGQPLTPVEYDFALKHKGMVFDEVDICDISQRGGVCGT